jgi:hypothetical protein
MRIILLPEAGQRGPAGGGEAIALPAAVGLVRDGHMDKPCFQGRLQVDLTEGLAIFEVNRPNGPGEPSPGLRPKADALGKRAEPPCGLKGRENPG